MNPSERYKPWNDAEETPDKATTKRMLAEALNIAVQFTMKNHLYQFDGKVMRQKRGGPIGPGLTGDVAQVFMVWWDQQMIKKLEANGMRVLLYLRYVDDIIVVVRDMSVNQDVGGAQPRDETNMLKVQEVANTIHPSIQVTIDCPSRHEDAKMPVLDLKAWPTQERDKVTRETTVRIVHEHYSKEISAKAVVNARSALPVKTKRTIHTQEVVRILRNCSRHLPWSVAREHVEQYMARMQFSGYKKEFRAEVVESALKAYDMMTERDATGEEPLYRPKGWKRVERAKGRRTKRTDWFRGKKGNESVIFIPATPHGGLRRRFVKAIEEAKVRIGVAEVPGTSPKRRLQRSDPFKEKKCKDENCLVCVEGDGGRCRVDGITYKVTCKRCDEVYVGETSKNAYTRGLEHLYSVTAPVSDPTKPKPTLRAHVDERHSADPSPPKFKMEVTGVYAGDATKRQVSEAVKIRNTAGQMNRQEEWRQIRLPRLGLS